MTEGTGRVPEEVHRAVRARWSEEQVVEIAAVAGIFNYFNRFNNALEVPPTEPSPLVERDGPE